MSYLLEKGWAYLNFRALNLYCQGRNGFIIVHFYVVNYTTPIFVGIILDKAENCKKFPPLIFGKIGSFNCIGVMIQQSIENLRYSCSGYAKVSGQIGTCFTAQFIRAKPGVLLGEL